MPNTTSAKKATRKIARKTAINKQRRSRYATYIHDVEDAITAGDGKKAREALSKAEPVIMRAAQSGVLHRNTAARKVSRLNSRVHKLGALSFTDLRVLDGGRLAAVFVFVLTCVLRATPFRCASVSAAREENFARRKARVIRTHLTQKMKKQQKLAS